MIRTKDLIEFMEIKIMNLTEGEKEYYHEIVTRLKERDEMVAGIEEMIKQICRDVNLARESGRLDE